MLPKKYRLTLSLFKKTPSPFKEFSAIFLNLKIKNKNNNLFPKFVIITPKKIGKKSTSRHLTKRIITEVIRIKLPNIKNPSYFLIKAKKIIRKKDRQNIEREMNVLFKQANLV
ncbi:ribonuclease P protein component [Candidatus Gottesmanbacteria bacterium]|nr:ribonuclease P protein component [Candidatus Gottesmanbacteria bacterium]